MSRQTGNTLLGSLRGKIWVSSSVLAFFICTFGLISYLVVSLLVNDPFYGIFIPFLLLAFTVMLFGWWLANEVVTPVENVTMLAQSMERSTSTSIPKTSGSKETDELLKTIQRNNQQYQKLVVAMDHVANGNLEIKPLQGSDRLSSAFQKLLTRVGESIHAKEELDGLKESIRALRMEVSGVRSGNLDVELKLDSPHTKDLAVTFRYLIDNLRQIIALVQEESGAVDAATNRIETELNELVNRDENRIVELNEASVVLKQVPGLINKISEDLRGSAKSARTSIEKAKLGNDIATQNSAAVSSLRKQIREDIKRLESLTERSHDIARVAKTVEDLANRTNMIALNASIQATELGEGGHGFVLVAEEVERLATRANGTNKQISTLNKSILAEIKKVENSIETSMSDVANLSKYAIESGNVIGELERYVGHFLNLQENLIAYSNDQSEETDEAFATYADTITETEATVSKLKKSDQDLKTVAKAMKHLKSTIGEFRLPDATQESVGHEEPAHFEAPEQSHDSESNEFNTEAFNAVRMDTEEFNVMNGESPVEKAVENENDIVAEPQTETQNDYLNQLSDFNSASDEEQPEAKDTAPAESSEVDPNSFAPGELGSEAFESSEENANSEEQEEAFESADFDSDDYLMSFEGNTSSPEVPAQENGHHADSTDFNSSEMIADALGDSDDSFDSSEFSLESFTPENDSDEFNSTELQSESLDAALENSPSASADLEIETFDSSELSAPADSSNDAFEIDGDVSLEDDLDDDVFDLYKASLNAPPDGPEANPEDELQESVFDSGEYKQDELIEAADEVAPLHFDAPETTQIDADEIADLLGGEFDAAPRRRQEDPASL